MSTEIIWTDETWNPVVGCAIVSPGCIHCYAMNMAGRLEAMAIAHMAKHGTYGPMAHYVGTTRKVKGSNSYAWTGQVNVAPDSIFLRPLEWKRPRRIFVNSMSDLFHENVPDDVVDRVFAIMALCPQHTFQLLTKRPDRMREYMLSIDNDDGTRINGLRDAMIEGNAQKIHHDRTGDDTVDEWLAVHLPLPNVWLGVSTEDQARADERIPLLLTTPAAVRWISAEPLLGPIDLTKISTLRFRGAEILNALTGELEGMFGDFCATKLPGLNWVVPGGESGPGARPMHPDWPRKLRDQCATAGTAFLFKQNGAWIQCLSGQAERWLASDGRVREIHEALPDPGGIAIRHVGKKAAGRELDGRTHDEYPETA